MTCTNVSRGEVICCTQVDKAEKVFNVRSRQVYDAHSELTSLPQILRHGKLSMGSILLAQEEKLRNGGSQHDSGLPKAHCTIIKLSTSKESQVMGS